MTSRSNNTQCALPPNLALRRFDSWHGIVGVCVAAASLVVGGSLGSVSSLARAASAPSKSAPDRAAILSVEVYLDAKSVGRNEFFQRNGSLFATDAQLKKWHLTRRANTPGIQFKDRTWFSLASIPDVEVVHYFAEKRVEIRTAAATAAVVMDTPAPAKTEPAIAPTAVAPKPELAPKVVESGQPRLLPLEVSINGAKSGNWLLQIGRAHV